MNKHTKLGIAPPTHTGIMIDLLRESGLHDAQQK
jgi:hypothetical protein